MDGAKPDKRWALYVTKGNEQLDPVALHRMSKHLFGRDKNCCEVLLEHNSISKQHAVIQFRKKASPILDEDGNMVCTIK